MKKIGIAIFIIGLVITLITGFNFMTKEKVVDIGKIEISKEKEHSFEWSPLVGVAVMAVGGGLYFFGRNEEKTT